MANPSLTIPSPHYNISVENLADWYASAYQRTYTTQNPAVIDEFYAQLDDMAHASYALGGKADSAYQAYYDAFKRKNGRNIGQQPEAIKRVSNALAYLTLWGLEYHRHTSIWQYQLYVDLLGFIFTDKAWDSTSEQRSIRIFLRELKDCATRV